MHRFGLMIAAAIVSLVTPAAASAQEAALRELDMYLDGSVTPQAALDTAAAQVKAGDVSGAATTLERLLLTDPDEVSVRVRYISVLCALDDLQAARLEVSKLAGAPIDDVAWAAVQSTCGPIAKP